VDLADEGAFCNNGRVHGGHASVRPPHAERPSGGRSSRQWVIHGGRPWLGFRRPATAGYYTDSGGPEAAGGRCSFFPKAPGIPGRQRRLLCPKAM